MCIAKAGGGASHEIGPVAGTMDRAGRGAVVPHRGQVKGQRSRLMKWTSHGMRRGDYGTVRLP